MGYLERPDRTVQNWKFVVAYWYHTYVIFHRAADTVIPGDDFHERVPVSILVFSKYQSAQGFKSLICFCLYQLSVVRY